MRFRVYVWTMIHATGTPSFAQAGAGSTAFDAALLTQIRDAMESGARGVYLVDTTALTITRLR